MAKSLQRRKPGFTKSGAVKIVSLSYSQLADLLSKSGKKKMEGKIRNRMRILESRPGFVKPVLAEPTATTE